MRFLRNYVLAFSATVLLSGSAFAQMTCQLPAPEECATYMDIMELLSLMATPMVSPVDTSEIYFPECYDPVTMMGFMMCDEQTPSKKDQVNTKRQEVTATFTEALMAYVKQSGRFDKVKAEAQRLTNIGQLPKNKAGFITNYLKDARTELNVADQNFSTAATKAMQARMAAQSGDLDGAITLYGQAISTYLSAQQRLNGVNIKSKIDQANTELKSVNPNWTNE